jgi:glycosyltransferase involved in cell wall biosynthesis
VLAHSHYEAALLRRLGVSADKVAPVLHGADVVCKGSAERFRDNYKISGPILLFLGRKSVAKGILRALNAWQLVRSVLPEAVFVLAGPPLDPLLGQRLDLGAESYSSSTGILNLDNLSDQLKHDALAACDVLCVPSEGESFGMVYLEACAYGKPVIALDLPVLRETIGGSGAGILVADNPAAISRAILQLLVNDQLRLGMGVQGRVLAAKHSWQNAIHDYLDCYLALSTGKFNGR